MVSNWISNISDVITVTASWLKLSQIHTNYFNSLENQLFIWFAVPSFSLFSILEPPLGIDQICNKQNRTAIFFRFKHQEHLI